MPAFLHFFPNPFADKVTIYFNLTEKAEATLTIRNILGKTVVQQSIACQEGKNELILTGEEFNQGGNLFIYTLVINGEIIHSGKMMKY